MEKTIESKLIFDGKLFEIRIDKIRLANGLIVNREIVHHRGSVGIIALQDEKKVVMIRQFRYPAGMNLLEIPAGTLEPNEEPLECAKRELIEETGYQAKSFQPLGEIYLAPGYCTEKIHLFFATNLEKIGQSTEVDEKISVELLHFDEVISKIHERKIIDSKSISGIYLASPLISKKLNNKEYN